LKQTYISVDSTEKGRKVPLFDTPLFGAEEGYDAGVEAYILSILQTHQLFVYSYNKEN